MYKNSFFNCQNLPNDHGVWPRGSQSVSQRTWSHPPEPLVWFPSHWKPAASQTSNPLLSAGAYQAWLDGQTSGSGKGWKEEAKLWACRWRCTEPQLKALQNSVELSRIQSISIWWNHCRGTISDGFKLWCSRRTAGQRCRKPARFASKTPLLGFLQVTSAHELYINEPDWHD